MPFKLSGLMLNRVDLCPDGSNPDAHIVLFKSKGGHMPAEKKKLVAKRGKKAVAKPQSKSKKKLEDDDEEEEEEDDDAAVNKSDDDDEDGLDDEDDDEEVDDDDDDEEEVAKGGRRKEDNDDEEDDDADKKKKRRKKPAKKVKKAVADDDDDETVDDEGDEDEGLGDDEDDLVDEEVMKTLPKHVQAIVAKQNARLRRIMKTAKEASALATVEKERRETLEFVEKAKRDIPNLTGTAEEKGELLKALFSGKPLESKIAKAIVKLLKAGDAAVKNLLMSETGSRRARTDEDDDAISLLREKAEEIAKKDSKLTKEQAFEKACVDNPDLFKQYRVEKRRASREEM